MEQALARLRRAFEGLVGLEQPRRRLLERAALQLRFGAGASAPLAVLTGPAGSGRHALAEALARGLGGPLVALDLRALGEAELRGVPRAGGGLEPGALMRALQGGPAPPAVLLLEHIDELAAGAPPAERARAAAALRELLRGGLVDRFAGAAVRGAHTLLVATAEHPAVIPPLLAGEVEVLLHHGYDRDQKVRIARERLLPEALRAAGAPPGSVEVTPAALERLVAEYAPEPGVAGLAERLGLVCRRAAARIALGEADVVRLGPEELPELLGPPLARPLPAGAGAEIGAAWGLTWLRRGGEVTLVEALRAGSEPGLVRGSAVRPEALESAFAFIRGRARELRIEREALLPAEVAIRATTLAPAGTGEDTASLTGWGAGSTSLTASTATAGIDPGLDLAVLVALVSLATDRPVRPDVAAVGELTLRGGVRPPAGLPEMVLAADRRGLRKVLVPAAGMDALERALPASTLARLRLVPVERAEEAARESLIDIVIARELDR
ncbi:MAG: hypothetical protein KatS3mg102_2756 [Planctomycetota bacterium]|nr:MAG: hypothetical protein KatS3mg102_2756 [Planctomycetota bacterium]